MNHIRYLLSRMSHLVYGIIPSLLMLFFPRNKKLVIFNSEFNTCFNHNSKHLFLYFLNCENEHIAKFVVNDNCLRLKLIAEYGEHFISTRSVKGVFIALSANTWVTSSLETPVGGLFLAYKRKVVHLGHGAPIKNVGLGEKYNSIFKKVYYALQYTNFSHFFSTSEVFDKAWSTCIGIPLCNIVRSPQARNELIRKTSSTNASRAILYAPTWRPFSDTLLFPFNDFDLTELQSYLEKENLFIYLRLHPNFESEASLYIDVDNIKLLGKGEVPDINEELSNFDLLITDYSSIYVDFLLTGKPILFLPYDLDEYNDSVGFTLDYDSYSPGPKPRTSQDFFKEVKELLDNENYFKKDRVVVNELLNPIKGSHLHQSYMSLMRIITSS